MSNFSSKLSPNIKIISVPLVTIVTVIMIFILFAPQGYSRINSKMTEFKNTQKEENILSSKLDSLKRLSSASLDPEDTSVIALPSKNPGMWIVSQIRRSSRETDIEIVKMSILNVNEKDEIKSSDVQFELEAGEYQSLLNFVKDLVVMLPIYSLKIISVERGQGEGVLFTGKVEATFYWSDFPKTLPAMNEPLNELTEDEINLIGIISGFKRPAFTELTPGQPQDRPMPFF